MKSLEKIQSWMKTRKEFKLEDTRVRKRAEQTIANARENVHDEANSILIQDKYTLRSYIEQMLKDEEYIIDLETTGLDTEDDVIVGVCLYSNGHGENSAYVPIFHMDLEGNLLPNQIPLDEVLEELQAFKNIDGKWINHNIKFDAKMFLHDFKLDLIDKIHWDTQVGARILNENEESALKTQYDKYILKKKPSGQKFKDLFDKVPFCFIPLDIAGVYGGNDGIKTMRLYEFQKDYLKADHERNDFRKLHHVFWDIEMPLLKVLVRMENKGVEIDVPYAKELEKMYGKVVEDNMNTLLATLSAKGLQNRIKKHDELQRLTKGTGKINFKSNSQVPIVFYDIMHFPKYKKYGTSCGKDVIALWEEEELHPMQVEFLEAFKLWRKNDKLLRDFIIKVPKALAHDNAVHSNFKQLGTDTGRFSSSHPVHKINLQQIPSRDKYIRKIFKAREGYVFVGSDYSQVEPRVLASLANETHMIEAYKQGQDLYAMMASKIYGVPYEQCLEFHPVTGEKQPEGKARRSSVKSILLGIMYDRGAGGIAQQCGKPKAWAEQIREDFFKTFPEIKNLRLATIYKAEKLGYVETVEGRKRRLIYMKKYCKNQGHPLYIAETRKCLNALIQGSSADIMKKAMVRLGNDPRMAETGSMMLMTVHDEVICEVPEEYALEIGKLISDTMKEVGEAITHIPMKCDVEISRFWSGDDITDELIEKYSK